MVNTAKYPLALSGVSCNSAPASFCEKLIGYCRVGCRRQVGSSVEGMQGARAAPLARLNPIHALGNANL